MTAHHGDIEGLGHHGNEHVQKEDPGRHVVQAEQNLAETFDASHLQLEDIQVDDTKQSPKERHEGGVQPGNVESVNRTIERGRGTTCSLSTSPSPRSWQAETKFADNFRRSKPRFLERSWTSWR